MFFGFQVQSLHLMLLGLVLFVGLAFELLVGLRKIRFKGRTHLKVHKAVAWSLLALGFVHGFAALLYFDYLSF